MPDTLTTPTTRTLGLPMLRISAGFGRLYVSGDARDRARLVRLPGATTHPKTGAVQLSLTLESLRAIRSMLNLSKSQMAALCTPDVLRWAIAAGRMEAQVNALHARLATGWRKSFPWYDRVGGRRPFEHQTVMATVADELDGVAFLCEMGTGKTRAAVEAINAKLGRGELDAVLVICPNGVRGTWAREVAQWTANLVAHRMEGSRQFRADYLRTYAAGRDEKVLILNYENVDALKADIVALAGRIKLGLVWDEAHRIKNPNADVTKASMDIARAVQWRLIMGGTPVSNSAMDIWSQWYVIDFGTTFGANYVQFRREFFEENPYNYRVTSTADSLREIGQRLRRRGLRYRKEDCLTLPPKIYEQIDVDMSPEQARAYRQMEESLVAWLQAGAPTGELHRFMPGDGDEDWGAVAPFVPPARVDNGRYATAANQLVAILRLTQITSGFVTTEDQSVHAFTPNPKLLALEDMIRANIDQQQIIVWAAYTNDINAICARLSDLNPVRIDGSRVGVRFRDEAERSFQAGESRLLIGNPAAGGVGLNLQAAALAAYYSQGYSLIARAQSEDRCHRSGSEIHNRITYIDMVCRGTIDEVVRQALIQKKQLAEVVVDLREHLGVTGR